VFCSGASWASQDKAAKVEFFESTIRPVLVKHCYHCHSVESGKSKGGLRLDSRGGWQFGGDSGPAIVPGKPDESHVVLAINRSGEVSEMPPKSRLSPEIVRDFNKWIADGKKHRTGNFREFRFLPKDLQAATGRAKMGRTFLGMVSPFVLIGLDKSGPCSLVNNNKEELDDSRVGSYFVGNPAGHRGTYHLSCVD
jgi:hypothetical protein